MIRLMDPSWKVPDFTVESFQPPKNKFALIVPVINEGERIKRQLERMKRAQIGLIADLIIADGGSTDGSLDSNFLRDQNVSVLLVKKGPGKLSAQLRMGYAYALSLGYQGIITVDGNNKDSVESIPLFVQGLRDGNDLVQGSRFLPGGAAINTPVIRWIAIKSLHVPLMNLAARYRFRFTDTTNGFKAYSRRFLLDPRVCPFRDVFDSYELLYYLTVQAPRLGFRVTEVPVTREYPRYGKTPTKISPLRGNFKMLKVVLGLVFNQYGPKAQRWALEN